MKVIRILDTTEQVHEICVEEYQVKKIAILLEFSSSVDRFTVDGIDCENQQRIYGAGGCVKWVDRLFFPCE